MKVFISWSGEKSKAVGELLDEWLKCVLQAVNPWMSSKDVDRGSLWFSQISDQLGDTGIGIVCITTSNLNKPWILFEAGALAKGLSSSRVCTFLVDLSPTDISDPLAQFNHTMPDKSGLWALVSTLNNLLGDKKLSEKVLENVFNTYWPQFESSFAKIMSETKEEIVDIERDEEDLLKEVLYMTRSFDKRLRNIEYNANKNSNMSDKLRDTARIKEMYIKKNLLNELENYDGTMDELKMIMSKYGKDIPSEDVIELVRKYANNNFIAERKNIRNKEIG